MRFGLLIPQTGPWDVLHGRCLEAERLGFESVWIGDHYFIESMPHVELLDAMAVLGAIAVSVPRVRFGAMTTNIIYRHPALIAKQAATLDVLSEGRFELGLGAGVYDADHRMTGSEPWSPAERVARFAEILDIVDRLLRGERVDHEGGHYRIMGGFVRPRPVQRPRPPISVGANGPRMIRVAAASADRWNTWGGHGLSVEDFWQAASERVALFDRALGDAGRDRRAVVRSLYVYRPLHPWASLEALTMIVDRARAVGFDELIFAWPGLLEPGDEGAQVDVMRRAAADVLGSRPAP